MKCGPYRVNLPRDMDAGSAVKSLKSSGAGTPTDLNLPGLPVDVSAYGHRGSVDELDWSWESDSSPGSSFTHRSSPVHRSSRLNTGDFVQVVHSKRTLRA